MQNIFFLVILVKKLPRPFCEIHLSIGNRIELVFFGVICTHAMTYRLLMFITCYFWMVGAGEELGEECQLLVILFVFSHIFSHWMTVIARETLILGINYFITHVNNTLCIGMFQIKCFWKYLQVDWVLFALLDPSKTSYWLELVFHGFWLVVYGH